jgi:hypothetical protein
MVVSVLLRNLPADATASEVLALCKPHGTEPTLDAAHREAKVQFDSIEQAIAVKRALNSMHAGTSGAFALSICCI